MLSITLSIILGSVTGFFLAIPPGPVATYIISTSLLSGKKHGLLAGVGVAVIDTIFCLVALGTGSMVLMSSKDYLDDKPIITLVIKILIILGMILYSLSMFRKTDVKSNSEGQEFKQKNTLHSSMLTGGFIALSNAVNPTFLPALIASVAIVTNSVTVFSQSSYSYLCFAIGFGLGTFLWFYIVTMLVVRHHAKFSPSVMGAMKSFTGGVILLFALYLAWQTYNSSI